MGNNWYRLKEIGSNSDPSWAPARTMFAGVGPRFVSGVALSGVLLTTTSLSSPRSSIDEHHRLAPSRSSSASSLSSLASNSGNSNSNSALSSSSAVFTSASSGYSSSLFSSSSSGVSSDHSLSSLSSGMSSMGSLSSHNFQRLLQTDLLASVKSEHLIGASVDFQSEALCIVADVTRW